MIMSHYFFFIWLILEARAEIQKRIRLFFGSNENFEICFWDLLIFNETSDSNIITRGGHKGNDKIPTATTKPIKVPLKKQKCIR